MPRKLFLFFIFPLFLLGAVLPQFSFSLAQSTPTPPPKEPTCDLCGWCGRFSLPPAPSPYNWPECYRCLYDASGRPNLKRYYTVFGCLDTNPGPLVRNFFSLALGISGGLAFLFFLYGSSLILTSRGNLEQLKNGREILISSLVGLFLVVFSIFILRLVGYHFLRIPFLE